MNAKEMNWPCPTQTTGRVEGWAFRSWGNVPHPGDQIEIDGGFQLIASEVSLRRIRRLRSIRKPLPIPAEGDAEHVDHDHHEVS